MAILDAIGVGEGDEVLLQAFTCNAVPNPILWAQAKPVYIDIADDLNIDPADLERKITLRRAQGKHPKAVIVQHTLGVPADMERVMRIAQQHNLIVIEDCAHALGATYKERLVGTLGDVSFFSFGRDKVISSIYGGMATTNNPEIGRKLEEFWKKCKYPSHFWVLQQLFHPVIFAIALPAYNFFALGKIMIKLGQRVKLLSLAVTRKEKKGGMPSYFPRRMPGALAVLALHQFRKLEKFNNHRKQIARFYQKSISSRNVIPVYDAVKTTNGGGSIFLRWSMLSFARDRILKTARRQGIYLGDWYASVIAPADTDLEKMHYIQGSCPKAEQVAKQIFNLPTHINISPKDARKIVEVLNAVNFK